MERLPFREAIVHKDYFTAPSLSYTVSVLNHKQKYNNLDALSSLLVVFGCGASVCEASTSNFFNATGWRRVPGNGNKIAGTFDAVVSTVNRTISSTCFAPAKVICVALQCDSRLGFNSSSIPEGSCSEFDYRLVTAPGVAAGAASTAPSAFSLPNAAVLVAAPGAPAPTFFLSTAHAIWAAQDDGSSVLFAGASTPGFAGDGASASNARFNTPLGLAAAPAADALLVADSGNSRVRMIMLSNATIKTLVGSGASKVSTGDGGPPAAALLVKPVAVAVSPATGDVFIADQGAACVRRARYGGVALTGARPGVIDTAVGTCDTTTAAFAALRRPSAAV